MKQTQYVANNALKGKLTKPKMSKRNKSPTLAPPSVAPRSPNIRAASTLPTPGPKRDEMITIGIIDKKSIKHDQLFVEEPQDPKKEASVIDMNTHGNHFNFDDKGMRASFQTILNNQ